MTETILILLTAAAAALAAAAAWTALRLSAKLDRMRQETAHFRDEANALRQEAERNRQEAAQNTAENLRSQNEAVYRALKSQTDLMRAMMQDVDGKVETLNKNVSWQLANLTKENARQLDQMRETVDEKLQKTLEERIGQSFAQVSRNLEQVSRGLGEMQNLARGVGDLKRVLSNVKTRGILGEIQLGAILDQILAPEQYAKNVNTKGSGREVVEYAVKLPGEEGRQVWLPIDSKFPQDTYAQLSEAYETGDQARIANARRSFANRIRSEAKDIRDKYLAPPRTTEFGIMFLPSEGIFAEVCRLGLIENLQNEYKVNVAGPTTMAALLNSLQMGFRTLAIQKRSGEVWETLAAVKTEFGKFEDVLKKAQANLVRANSDLDALVGVRTRVMRQKLRDVTALDREDAARILDGPAEYENKTESDEIGK